MKRGWDVRLLEGWLKLLYHYGNVTGDGKQIHLLLTII